MKHILFILAGLISLGQVHAKKVETMMVYSPSMEKQIPNLVILPDDYAGSGEDFPVLYLLHGAGGNQNSWLQIEPELTSFVNEYDFIIVCPDGGFTSWYFDSPVDPEMKYETYISEELVKQVDDTYTTIADEDGRAISGYSMGGHGAFYLAIRHPDIWGAAGSMSGGLDFRPFPNGWDLPSRLGNYSKHPENWESNTVINMVDEIPGSELQLIFDCGEDDFFLEGNNDLHEKLKECSIPHSYTIRPGEHNGAYWANSIQYQLRFFDEFFDSSFD